MRESKLAVPIFQVLRSGCEDAQKFEILNAALKENPAILQANDPDNSQQISVLHAATEKCDAKVLQLLLEKAPTLIKRTTTDGTNVLYYAALKGNSLAVKFYFQEYPDLVFDTGLIKYNFLSFAAKVGDTDLFEKFLEFLKKVPHIDLLSYMKGVLIFAAQCRQFDFMKWFFHQYKAFVIFNPCELDQAARHVVCLRAQAKLEKSTLADIYDQMHQWFCELGFQGDEKFSMEKYNSHARHLMRGVKLVKEDFILLFKGGDFSSLFIADDPSHIQGLIAAGLDIHQAIGNGGKPLLHFAASTNARHIFNFLISLGCRFLPDNQGSYPQHHAASNGHFELLASMLDLPACDINVRMINDLNYSVLETTMAAGHLTGCELLIKKGAQLGFDKNGYHTLHHAALYRRVDIFKAVWQYAKDHVDINVRSKNPAVSGFSALDIAVSFNDEVMLEELLTCKPAVETGLCQAAFRGNLPIFAKILSLSQHQPALKYQFLLGLAGILPKTKESKLESKLSDQSNVTVDFELFVNCFEQRGLPNNNWVHTNSILLPVNILKKLSEKLDKEEFKILLAFILVNNFPFSDQNLKTFLDNLETLFGRLFVQEVINKIINSILPEREFSNVFRPVEIFYKEHFEARFKDVMQRMQPNSVLYLFRHINNSQLKVIFDIYGQEFEPEVLLAYVTGPQQLKTYLDYLFKPEICRQFVYGNWTDILRVHCRVEEGAALANILTSYFTSSELQLLILHSFETLLQHPNLSMLKNIFSQIQKPEAEGIIDRFEQFFLSPHAKNFQGMLRIEYLEFYWPYFANLPLKYRIEVLSAWTCNFNEGNLNFHLINHFLRLLQLFTQDSERADFLSQLKIDLAEKIELLKKDDVPLDGKVFKVAVSFLENLSCNIRSQNFLLAIRQQLHFKEMMGQDIASIQWVESAVIILSNLAQAAKDFRPVLKTGSSIFIPNNIKAIVGSYLIGKPNKTPLHMSLWILQVIRGAKATVVEEKDAQLQKRKLNAIREANFWVGLNEVIKRETKKLELGWRG